MPEPEGIPCPICGEEILDDLDSCPNCGAAVDVRALRELMRVLGVGSDKAHELFRAGYRNPSDLEGRSVADALKARGSGVLYLCPECGAFVSSTDTACGKCGARLTEEAMDLEKFLEEEATRPCPACGEAVPADALVCPACQAEIAVEPAGPAPTTVLCPHCGAAVLEDQATCDTCGKPILEVPAAPAAEDREAEAIETLLEGVEPAAEEVAEKLDRFAAEMEAEEAVAELEAAPPRPVQRAAELPATRLIVPVPPRPSRADRFRDSVVLATLVALLPLGVAVLVRSEAGRWAVLAVVGSLFASALALTFLDPAPVRRHRRAHALATVGGLAVLAVPVTAAIGVVLPEAGGGLLLAAGAALLIGAAVPFRRPGAAYAPWLAALPGLLAVASALAVGAPPGPAVLATGTVLVLGLAVGASAGVVLRSRWVERRVSRSVRRAQDLATRREYRAAITELDRAIALTGERGSEAPWYSKGAALVVLGRYEEAMACIDTALRINPRNEVAWVNKGNALVRMGRLVDALKCYNSAIKVNPRYEVAWNNKGNGLARMGKFEDALRCYERALVLDRTYRGAWVNKGYVLTKLGDFEGAAECADEVLRLGGPRGVAA